MSFQLKTAPHLTGEENVCELDREWESEGAGKGVHEERGTRNISRFIKWTPGSYGDKTSWS